MEHASAFQWVSRLASLLLFISFLTTRFPWKLETLNRQGLPPEDAQEQVFSSQTLKLEVHTQKFEQIAPEGALRKQDLSVETLSDQLSDAETLNTFLSRETIEGKSIPPHRISAQGTHNQNVPAGSLNHVVSEGTQNLIIQEGTQNQVVPVERSNRVVVSEGTLTQIIPEGTQNQIVPPERLNHVVLEEELNKIFPDVIQNQNFPAQILNHAVSEGELDEVVPEVPQNRMDPVERLNHVVSERKLNQIIPEGTQNQNFAAQNLNHVVAEGEIIPDVTQNQIAPVERLNRVVSGRKLNQIIPEGTQNQNFPAENSNHRAVFEGTLNQITPNQNTVAIPEQTLNRAVHRGAENRVVTTRIKNGTDKREEAGEDAIPCQGVKRHLGYGSSCEYIRSDPACGNRSSTSVFDYTAFFFCTCARLPSVGYVVLAAWLMVLFYALGNTAADYFCGSLEKLSRLLGCPPTLAGVTLLPLGNGAPDVFASIASFIGANAGEVGLNSVIGGGVFITTVVAGAVSLLASRQQPSHNNNQRRRRRRSEKRIDRRSFFRDVGFFLLALLALAAILAAGRVHLWAAAMFVSIYGLYALSVAASEVWRERPERPEWSQIQLLPFTSGASLLEQEEDDDEDDGEEDSAYSPLLDGPSSASASAAEAEAEAEEDGASNNALPRWRWASNVAIYSHKPLSNGEEAAAPWGWGEERGAARSAMRLLANALEWPLALPRRLTIPVVDDERWSWGFALASAGLAPVFLAFALRSHAADASNNSNASRYIAGALLGLLLVVLAYASTPATGPPPRRLSLPWVLAGFVMSIAWFFVIANELVALLLTFGLIVDVDPSVLGLTLLAWGNSMGDLMANTALASGGGDGVQIALSGCYAGPMFNTLIGIGISLVLASWASRPRPYAIPRDDSLFATLAFLVAGLLWALLVLPLSKMRPSRLLGVGLLLLYAVFLSFRLAHALGFLATTAS